MQPLSLRTVLCVLVVLGTCAFAAVGGASGKVAECAASAARGSSDARISTLHSYDDYIEDVATAPDICGSNVVTNDNLGAITIAMHIHDRSGFAAGDGYHIFFDTDSNAGTGSIAAAGQPAGAEYKLEIVDDTSNLSHWTGTVFEPASTQTPILTTWLSGFGPALELNRRDLGDAASFRFVFVTSNGADVDLAPDVATWSYALSALQLTAGRLVLSPARAGIRLLAHMEVERSDFEIPLTEIGRASCRERVSDTV